MVFRLIAAAIVGFGWHGAVLAAWPPEVETAVFTSPADGSEQKTLLYAPPGDDPGPLLVAFHTWSGDYRQDEALYAEWCIARGWAFVHSDVRGPANRKKRRLGLTSRLRTSAGSSILRNQSGRSIQSESMRSVSRGAG